MKNPLNKRFPRELKTELAKYIVINVIGTLRASGYTKGELILHYLTMPVIVTLLAALVGNILGYTLFKNAAAGMYYGSYSLPTYETRWMSR